MVQKSCTCSSLKKKKKINNGNKPISIFCYLQDLLVQFMEFNFKSVNSFETSPVVSCHCSTVKKYCKNICVAQDKCFVFISIFCTKLDLNCKNSFFRRYVIFAFFFDFYIF